MSLLLLFAGAFGVGVTPEPRVLVLDASYRSEITIDASSRDGLELDGSYQESPDDFDGTEG